MKKELEAITKSIKVSDDGPIVNAVVFMLERISDPNGPDTAIDFEPHVEVLGDGAEDYTLGGLLHRYHILSGAMAAIHDAMDATIELMDEITAPPEPEESKERLLS